MQQAETVMTNGPVGGPDGGNLNMESIDQDDCWKVIDSYFK